MPNPKSGTVTDKIGDAVKNAKSGQVRFKTDKGGTIHGCIGKVSYSPTQLEENTKVLIDEVKKLKPASAKGVYIKNVSLSSTMGPHCAAERYVLNVNTFSRGRFKFFNLIN